MFKQREVIWGLLKTGLRGFIEGGKKRKERKVCVDVCRQYEYKPTRVKTKALSKTKKKKKKPRRSKRNSSRLEAQPHTFASCHVGGWGGVASKWDASKPSFPSFQGRENKKENKGGRDPTCLPGRMEISAGSCPPPLPSPPSLRTRSLHTHPPLQGHPSGQICCSCCGRKTC